MSDIPIAQVRRLDMTQLLVFSALMRRRNLTRVATEVGLTQSAVSHILKRLRDTFGDELFLRRPTGIDPTTRAIALEPLVNEILNLSKQALQIEQDFDPATAKMIVRIAGPDIQMALFAPLLIALFGQKAPGLRLSFTNQTRDDALVSLSSGQIDIGLGFFWSLGDQFEKERLYSENYQIVFRRGHPLESTKIDLATYCAADHLLVSVSGNLEGIVDNTLTALGTKRQVKASVGQFFPAMSTVACTDMLTTIPARLADRYCNQFGLVSRDVPFAIRTYEVSAVWHKRTTTDLALRWVRERMRDLVV
jgi:DNA-binding transcriptional LysR family regulator